VLDFAESSTRKHSPVWDGKDQGGDPSGDRRPIVGHSALIKLTELTLARAEFRLN
jgi:hypothetical protein